MTAKFRTNAYFIHYQGPAYGDEYAEHLKVISDNEFFVGFPDFRKEYNFIIISTPRSEDFVKLVFSHIKNTIVEKITTETLLDNYSHLQMFDTIKGLSKKVIFNDINIQEVERELELRQRSLEEND